MIRSRKDLEEASERVFCEEFLIPLFKAMGFRDVIYWHGGALERGKDLVMWKAGDFSPRINYAVVAKAQRIKGNVGMQSEVLLQIQQALATDFSDATTAQPQRATQVLVACTHDITKEALGSLGPLLESQGLIGHVEFLGIDRLWELAEQHLMPWLLADSLSRARIALLEIDPDYKVEASLTQEAVLYTITPKHESARPLTFNSAPDFPDTEEGNRLRVAFAEFIRSGGPVSIERPVVPLVDPPPLFNYLLPSASRGPFELSMLPRVPPEPMLYRIYAKSATRQSEIPYVHFTTLHGGLVKTRITNEDQPIPLRIELELDKDSPEGRFTWSLQPEEVPLYWALIFCELTSTLAEGASVELENLRKSGPRLRVLSTGPGDITAPGEPLLQLLSRVREIEIRIRQTVMVRDLRHISEDEIRGVAQAEHILRTGVLPQTTATVDVAFAPPFEQLETLVATSKAGGGELQFGRPSHSLPVLGNEVDFGPVQVVFEKALIHPDDLPAVEAAIASERQEDITFRFVCATGTHCRVVFERWLPSA